MEKRRGKSRKSVLQSTKEERRRKTHQSTITFGVNFAFVKRSAAALTCEAS